MHHYVNRRKRCWKLLKELDPEIQLSEGHRADMLLDLAGIDRGEKIMIQASIGNVRDFDKIAEALTLQHPRIHLRDKGVHSSFPKGSKGSGKRKSGGKSFVKGKGKRRKGGGKGKFRKAAHLADSCGWGEWPDEYADQWDDAAYLAGGMEQPDPYSDPAHWSEEEDQYDATSWE